jgi:hypothetical protein
MGEGGGGGEGPVEWGQMMLTRGAGWPPSTTSMMWSVLEMWNLGRADEAIIIVLRLTLGWTCSSKGLAGRSLEWPLRQGRSWPEEHYRKEQNYYQLEDGYKYEYGEDGFWIVLLCLCLFV